MRALWILVIVGICLFSYQAWHYRSETQSRLQQSVAMLPDKPEEAYKNVEPLYDYSDIKTFGLASDSRDRFFDAVRDRLIARLRANDPLPPDFFYSVHNTFKVLHDAKQKHRQPTEPHIGDIVKAMNETHVNVASLVSLAAWDTFVSQINVSEQEGLIPPSAGDDLQRLKSDLGRVDRRAIGLRETTQISIESLGGADKAIGLEPSSAQGPLFGLIGAPLKDSQIIAADEIFIRGQGEIQKFGRMFKEPQLTTPMRLLQLKLMISQNGMRLAHLIDGGPKLGDNPSDYFVKLFVRQGTEELPTSNEMYGAYINNLATGINTCIREAASLTGDPELPQLAAAAYILRIRYDQFLQSAGNDNPWIKQYPEVRQAAFKSPNGEKAITILENENRPFVVLR